MKKNILFFILICLSNQVTQTITNETIEKLKWAYLTISPLIYGHLATNAIINSSKAEPQRKDILPNDNKSNELNDQIIKKQEEAIQKTKKFDPKLLRCALCQGFSNRIYFVLLTYGSIINLSERIIAKDPGSFLSISLKPILNAIWMYGASHIIDKAAKYQLLNN